MTATSPHAADLPHILERSGDLWDALRGERVLVTGGTGFVGRWLIEAFVAANRTYGLGARAVLVTRDPARFVAQAPHLAADAAIELLAADVVELDPPPGSFAFVVHAATERYHPPDAARPVSILDRDVAATRRVLDVAVQRGVRRLLFTSSGAAYGPQPPELERIPEEYRGAPDTTDPRSAYGQGKRVSEFACATYGEVHGFDAVVARLFAFVGPHLPLDEGYAIGNFIADVLAGRSISIGGDGTPYRSYLYAADLAVWLWTLLVRGTGGRIYNVGSPDAVSIRELAGSVVAALAPGTPIAIARSPAANALPSRYVPSTERAETELGLRAWIPLEDALRRTFTYHQRARRLSTVP